MFHVLNSCYIFVVNIIPAITLAVTNNYIMSILLNTHLLSTFTGMQTNTLKRNLTKKRTEEVKNAVE